VITQNLRRLQRYSSYRSLTSSETYELILLCELLDPDLLIDECIFEDEEACPTTRNTFYNISSIQTTFAVAESIIFGAEYVEVVNIMCYRRQWLETYYVQPLDELNSAIARQLRESLASHDHSRSAARRSNMQSQNTRPRQISHDPPNRSNPPSQRRRQKRPNRQNYRYRAISKHRTHNDDECCCCVIL